MNLRIRDNLLYGYFRLLAVSGRIRAPSVDEIRGAGFERVLVVATTAIGDAVLCTPLLDSLRAARPGLRIGFWVTEIAACLFRGATGPDVVLPYHGKYARVRETLRLLRAEKFDLALVANANDPDVIPLIWRSACTRIIRRPQRDTIYSFMVANPEMLSRSHTSGHAIERNLQFCDLLALPRGSARTRLEVNPETAKQVTAMLEGVARPWWVIHPGASRSRKQWGAGNYAELARRLIGRATGSVILTGSPEEMETCDVIQTGLGAGHRVRNLAGRLRLDELAALLKHSRLLVSGDTGPYHIAMAIGTATVTLFAPWDVGSSAAINGPFFDQHCHRVVETRRLGDHITSISVEQVLGKCEPLLNTP